MPGDLSTATVSAAAAAARYPSSSSSAAAAATDWPAPTAWEVDISSLRGGGPVRPASDEDEGGVKPRPVMRPPPGARPRRSHAGWMCEIVV